MDGSAQRDSSMHHPNGAALESDYPSRAMPDLIGDICLLDLVKTDEVTLLVRSTNWNRLPEHSCTQPSAAVQLNPCTLGVQAELGSDGECQLGVK